MNLSFILHNFYLFLIPLLQPREEFELIQPIISSIPESADPLIVVVSVTKNSTSSTADAEFPLRMEEWWVEHGVGRVCAVFAPTGAEVSFVRSAEDASEGSAGVRELCECHAWPHTQSNTRMNYFSFFFIEYFKLLGCGIIFYFYLFFFDLLYLFIYVFCCA